MCVANPTVAFILSPEESVEEYVEDVGILLQTVSVSFSVSTQCSDCQIDCNIANVGLGLSGSNISVFLRLSLPVHNFSDQ